MKSYCDFHPLEPARWLCNQCQVFYCKSCTPDRLPTCPVCQKSLEDLGSSNEISPFWDRLPDFFKYPLSGQSLILLLASGFIFAFAKENLSSALTIFAIFTLQTLYGFSVLRSTAEGELSPPPLIRMFAGNVKTLFKSIIWMIGLALLAASGFYVSPVLGAVTMMFVFFIYPASAIILVHESEAIASLNPLRLIDFVARTRSGYLILYVHILIIMTASGAAQEWFAPEPGGSDLLKQGLFGVVSAFFYIMLFNMLGYFLLQYQRELGFVAVVNTGVGEEPVEVDLLHRAKLWVKMGDYSNAISNLESLRKAHPQNEQLKIYYWELLIQTQNFEKLAMFADPISLRFLSTNRLQELQPFLHYMMQSRPNGFNELATKLKLAEAFINIQQPKWAYGLLKNVHQQFEFDPKRLDALMMLTEALQQLKQKAQAIKVLKYAYGIADRHQKEVIQARIEALEA